MRLRRAVKGLLLVVVWLTASSLAWPGVAMASQYHGQVTFGGLPLPGTTVTVTATQGSKTVVAVSDDQGLFSFADLADGTWSLDLEMTGFAPIKQDVLVGPNAPMGTFEMKLLTLEQIRAAAKPVKVDVTAPAVASAAAPAASTTAEAAPAGATAAAPAAGKGAATTAKGADAGKGAAATTQAANAPAPMAPEPTQDATAQQANDGFLINGSVNNAATSQFSQSAAFGNNRNGGRWLYNGGLSLVLQNSALNAKTFSLDGQDSPKPPYTDIVAGAQFGGPLKIPHLIPAAHAPYFYVGYSRTQNKNDSLASVLVPTLAERSGDLSQAPNVTKIYVPSDLQASNNACYSYLLGTGVTQMQIASGTQVFAGNIIPPACISPVVVNPSNPADGLLNFYPAPSPNLAGSQYNYQVPLANDTHSDSYRVTLQKQLGNKNNVNGTFSASDTRSSNPSLFGFLDTSSTLNISVNAGWYHRFTQRLSMNASYNFSRSRSNSVSYFANKTNVEGNAGITGFYQDPMYGPTYWGPPGLGFSSGLAGLSDGTNATNRPETNSVSYSMNWNRFRHEMAFGGDFRRQEWNYLSEANPRGSLTFTGPGGATSDGSSTAGSDFADFLLGIPDSSAIGYGNADKYLRQSVYDLYFNDNFRVNPELSVLAGLRWEYGAPVTEIKNRLVNLDVTPNFTAEQAVLATSPKGPVSGQGYPTSLVRPDYSFPEPRIGIAWRPISGSSLLIRAGYGIYNDTSVYRSTALAMAQQTPGANAPWQFTSLSVPNSASCRYTITAPFQQLACAKTTPDQFAVDPNFKVGYAQAWQLSVQRDLPWSLQMVATYSGVKGTRGVQEILPNSYPLGLAASPYGAAPVGYYYRDSNGDSTREAGNLQLRRRLRNGFTANLSYTFSKSLDDDYSLGGGQGTANPGGGSPQVAQDWTNPAGQRGLSTFDQRNALNASLQYTTGMGIGGHTLLSGWKGLIYKEWTVVATISEASGTPLTPIAPGLVPGTSFSNIIRANYVGGAIHENLPNGVFLNPNAFVAPTSGWGTARRDSITGPSQFGLNASMNRGFRIHDRYNLTAQIDANNVLNHVAYSGWNTTIGPLFGTAGGAGGMRSVQITLRARF